MLLCLRVAYQFRWYWFEALKYLMFSFNLKDSLIKAVFFVIRDCIIKFYFFTV
jgi:hypothetical protein